MQVILNVSSKGWMHSEETSGRSQTVRHRGSVGNPGQCSGLDHPAGERALFRGWLHPHIHRSTPQSERVEMAKIKVKCPDGHEMYIEKWERKACPKCGRVVIGPEAK